MRFALYDKANKGYPTGGYSYNPVHPNIDCAFLTTTKDSASRIAKKFLNQYLEEQLRSPNQSIVQYTNDFQAVSIEPIYEIHAVELVTKEIVPFIVKPKKEVKGGGFVIFSVNHNGETEVYATDTSFVVIGSPRTKIYTRKSAAEDCASIMTTTGRRCMAVPALDVEKQVEHYKQELRVLKKDW